MVSMEQRLGPNEKEVAAKVLDGEAIIIKFTGGMYYSMDQVGGVIWEFIEKKKTFQEIIEGVTHRYEISFDQAKVDVERVVAELIEENLIALSADEPDKKLTEALEGVVQDKAEYVPPKLNVYRDVQVQFQNRYSRPPVDRTLAAVSARACPDVSEPVLPGPCGGADHHRLTLNGRHLNRGRR